MTKKDSLLERFAQQANLALCDIPPLIYGNCGKYEYAYNFETGVLARTKKGNIPDFLNRYPDFKKGHGRSDPDDKVSRIQFFPTLACNMRCIYCYNSSGAAKSYQVIQKNTIKAGIDYAVANSPQFLLVHFIGGEPTLFLEPLQYAVEYANASAPFTDFYIVTNGTCKIQTLDYLIENDFEIIFSLDGIRDVNDVYRPMASGKSSFGLVVENLKRLCKAKGMRVLVRATLTNISFLHFDEFLDFLGDIGVRRLRCEPMLTEAGRAKTNDLRLGIDSQEFTLRFLRLLQIADKNGIEFDTPLSKYIRLRDKRFRRPIIVLPNGDVTSSAVVCNPRQEEYEDFVYGRLITGGKLISFPGKRKASLYRYQLNSDRLCSDCSIVSLCGGRLRGYEFSSAAYCAKDSVICDLYRGMLTASMHFYACQQELDNNAHGISIWENAF